MEYRVQLRDSWPDFPPPSGVHNWWWVLKSAGNGHILATSETYTTKAKALKAAQALAERLGIEVER
jgi:hypothetical protein